MRRISNCISAPVFLAGYASGRSRGAHTLGKPGVWLYPPNVFIPVAEEIDSIFKIGKWVMQETIRQSIAWNKQYSMPLKIGFNISPKQFNDGGFIQLLKALIVNTDLNPAWIDAEITESIMLQGEDHHVEDVFRL